MQLLCLQAFRLSLAGRRSTSSHSYGSRNLPVSSGVLDQSGNPCMPPPRLPLDFGLWRSYSAVTVSSAGPRGLFKGMTTATSGVIARFPLLLPVRNSVASYGASAVTRTSDRGHVAEVKNQCHRSGGVSIRVSKETELHGTHSSGPERALSAG